MPARLFAPASLWSAPIDPLQLPLCRGHRSLGVLAAGAASLVVADLVLAFAATPFAALAGVAVWGLHMGFTQGLFAALVADVARAEHRGTAFGVFNLMTGVALLAASALAGALWDAGVPRVTFLAGAALTALAVVTTTVLHATAGLPRRAAH